jgi:hypothetical protein
MAKPKKKAGKAQAQAKAKPKPKPAPQPTSNGEAAKDKGEGEGTPPTKKRYWHSLGNSLQVEEEKQSPAEEHFLGPEDEEAPVQGELLRVPEKPPAKSLVQGYIAMHFVSYRAYKDKERDLMVVLDFSLDLVPELAGFLPREIEDAWHDLEDKHYTAVEPPESEVQNMRFYLTPATDPETQDPDLEVSMLLETAYIEHVEERGKGKKRDVVRLSMRFESDMTEDVNHFCMIALDETVYAKIEAAQRDLPEAETETAKQD